MAAESNSNVQPDTGNEPTINNPIVQVNLLAQAGQFVFAESGEPYVGLYHKHQDGTLMIGEGILGVNHELIPGEIIIPVVVENQQDIPNPPDSMGVVVTKQLLKELIHDKIVRLFANLNITREQLLNNQKTIRQGLIEKSRLDDEILVLYQRDGDIYTDDSDENVKINSLVDSIYYSLPGANTGEAMSNEGTLQQITNTFEITKTESDNITTYTLYTHRQSPGDPGPIVVGKIGNDGTVYNALNIGQLIYTNTNIQYDTTKARAVLDTEIDELLPDANRRQQLIDDFFRLWAELRPPNYPNYIDTDGDGFTDFISLEEFTQFSENNISNSNNPNNKFITWLQEQEDIENINKSLEWLYKDLQNYFAESIADTDFIDDPRPLYINKSDGYLKLRSLNQSILIRKQEGTDIGLIGNDPNNPVYLSDGFTLTMWVRFLNKEQTGTLMNYGNPFSTRFDQKGFALETIIIKADEVVTFSDLTHPELITLYDGNQVTTTYGEFVQRANQFGNIFPNMFVDRDTVRLLRLSVIDGDGNYIDNSIPKEITNNVRLYKHINTSDSPIPQVGNQNGIQLLTYTQIPIDFDEWFFINASFDPTITQQDNSVNQYIDDYWNNQYNPTSNQFVENSGVGNQCVIEYISKSDLIRARGFRVE